jgi:hypothetical protein
LPCKNINKGYEIEEAPEPMKIAIFDVELPNLIGFRN